MKHSSIDVICVSIRVLKALAILEKMVQMYLHLELLTYIKN